MTTEELYQKINGDFADAKTRLMSERIISKFIQKFPMDQSFASLVAAYEAKDSDAIFKASHTLKGVCANLAIKGLQVIASEITEAYRPGHEAARACFDLDQRMKDLSKEYQLVTDQIVQYSNENA